MKENAKKFIKAMIFGILITLAVFLLGHSRGYGTARCFCDAFFVSAAFLFSAGGLAYVKNKGAFDVMGFGISHSFKTHFPAFGVPDDNLEAFKERKERERKSAVPMILAAFIFLVLSLVMLAFN